MNRMTVRTGLLLAVVCILAPQARADGDPPHFAADRPVDIEHLRLDLKVDLPKKTVDSIATISGAALRPISSIKLNAVDFDLRGATLQINDGPPIKTTCHNDGQYIEIPLPAMLPAGGRFTATLDYRVTDPTNGLSFFAPSEEEPDVPYLVWSQGQTSTNRYWVPCVDRPNEMQTTEIICTVAKPHIVISNGKALETVENKDGTRTFHWQQTKPHSAYLMTLIVGDFISKTDTWRGKPVTYYVREKFKDQIDNSFAKTPAMLEHFSKLIGVEYPWDKYTQTCCYAFGGGMENTSATTLGENTLHDDRAHLDQDSDGLVAHELAHQWFGDLLTCREWSHTWLNEGFASYFEALWDEHDQGDDEFAYNMYRKAQGAISGGKDKPIVYRDYKDEGEQFDSRAYPKGAWVLHMIRRQLGDELFWKVIHEYTTRFSHKNVETFDFRKTIEDVTGRSFERFFYDWTERPGCPVVSLEYKWLEDDKMASVTVKQTQKEAAFFFPLRMAFLYEGDAKPTVINRDMTQKDERFLIPLPGRPVLVRVDPEQAVLMELTVTQPRDLWVAQLEREKNPAARIAAVKYFAKAKTRPDQDLLAKRLTLEPFWAVAAEIARSLGEIGEDHNRDALLAAIGLEHPKARVAVVEALGKFDTDTKVEKALRELIDKGDASYRVEAAAIEAWAAQRPEGANERLTGLLSRESHGEIIRSAALRGLAGLRDPAAIETLMTWSRPGKPMQCRAAAISGLGQLLKDTDPDAKTLEAAVKSMTDALKSKSRWLPGAALGALGDLGRSARSALPEIDNLAANGRMRMKSRAAEVAKRIRDNTPVPSQVTELRDKVKNLEQENKELMIRLERLEAAGKAKPMAAAGSSAPSGDQDVK